MYSPFLVVQDEASVTVATTTTVLVPSAQTGPSDTYSGEVVNNDVSQTINFYVQTSWNGSRWYTSEWQGGESVQPGEARPFTVDVSKYRYVRVVGTSSSGGCSSTCSAELGYSTGPSSNRR